MSHSTTRPPVASEGSGADLVGDAVQAVHEVGSTGEPARREIRGDLLDLRLRSGGRAGRTRRASRCSARYGRRAASGRRARSRSAAARSTERRSPVPSGRAVAFLPPNGFLRRSLNWSLDCWVCHAISSADDIEAICSSDSMHAHASRTRGRTRRRARGAAAAPRGRHGGRARRPARRRPGLRGGDLGHLLVVRGALLRRQRREGLLARALAAEARRHGVLRRLEVLQKPHRPRPPAWVRRRQPTRRSSRPASSEKQGSRRNRDGFATVARVRRRVAETE